ncbi:MAG: peptidase T [Pseudomonadota bacterium]
MSAPFTAELEDRIVRYCAVDSQSDEASPSVPSTAVQYDMLNLLVGELKAMGAADVTLTDYATVLATLPATVPDAPVFGLMAHVDTAPAFAAAGVKPVVHRAYNGGPIRFADNHDLELSPEEFPYLAQKTGDDIITASGTTLLGADDKAGVAIAMTMAQHLLENPDIPHGEIRLVFTTDEEIGRGVQPVLAKDIKADFAYTLDGAEVGMFEYESFSADKAVVTVEGVSIHPGTAKDMLVNALHLAAKIIATLPQATRTPETTRGREGFIMITEMSGSAAKAELQFILRDFERDGLEAHGTLLRDVCAAVQATEPRARIDVEISHQYRNMRYWLEDDMRPVDLALAAYRATGIEPEIHAIRGGTDGSRLTEFGVPTPNIFTGMQNLHGPLEWISVQDMAKATEVCVNLAQIVAADAR